MGLGIVSFILLILVFVQVIILNTDAVEEAKQYIRTNPRITREIGAVEGFGFQINSGQVSTSGSSESEAGEAQVSLIVKGENAYRDMDVYLVKVGAGWQVRHFE